MTTEMMVKKLNKEVGELKSEVKAMRRLFLTSPKDPEGEYKKSFIQKILARVQGGGPFYEFTDRQSFLRHVRGK